MGVWKIWFSTLNFHSFSKRTRGGGHGQSLQEIFLDSIFPGAGGVDRSLGPGDHRARRRLVWKIWFPILNFHNLGAGSPSWHDTRRVRNSSLVLPERVRNHCAVAYLALASQHTLLVLGQRVC